MTHKKCHTFIFLEYKEGYLELVFGGHFGQLHNFLLISIFSKVQVQSKKLETKSALKNTYHMWMWRFHECINQ